MCTFVCSQVGCFNAVLAYVCASLGSQYWTNVAFYMFQVSPCM